MTLREHSLKNIYIGEYKVRHYDYTFKWKTAAEIWNEWTTQVGTIAVNSEWATGTSSQEMRITKSISSLANAKRIIINSTVVWQNTVYTAGNVWIWKWTWWWNWTTIFCVFWSQYWGIHARINYNWTDYAWNSIWNATESTYKTTLTIDLEQKTIVWSISWFGDSTLSLSDAQVSDIRTYTYLVCYTSLNRSTISDVSIDIIY